MNMKRRLAFQFTAQLAITGTIVLLIAAICVLWVFRQLTEISFSRDFASVGLERLVESSQLGQDGIRFDPELLAKVKQNNGWIQSLAENGQVEHSYNTPADVPKHYAPGELVDYWTKKKEFPYALYLWIQEKDGKLFTIIYGVQNDLELLLSSIVANTDLTITGELELPENIANQITTLEGYIQLLDSQGRELASFNKPNTSASHYTVQDLVLRTMYSARYSAELSSVYDEKTGRTWVISLPHQRGKDMGEGMLRSPEAKVLLIGITSMIIALIIVFIIQSLWNAHRFGAPMLHMLSWLDSLGKAKFKEPVDRNGIARSRTKSGGWRSRYRVFSDVMISTNNLSDTLRRDQELRMKNNSLREEWISGITHDLKTPLSSIKGYAHMLSEERYEWTTEQVRAFTQIMLEKSAHMDGLINDLALTYRMNADIKLPKGDQLELNKWLRETLDRAMDTPSIDKSRIRFQPAETDISVIMHAPWLERVVMNVTANALLHNPPNTILTVSLFAENDGKGMSIHFSDNGNGMDTYTADRLFNRYYRGTDTSSAINGSGLGMAIAKSLVEAMDGRIMVETSPGKGTTIRLIWNNEEPALIR